MQQNPNSEYRIPNSDYQESRESVDDVYQKIENSDYLDHSQPEAKNRIRLTNTNIVSFPNQFQSHPEQLINPISAKLYHIGDELAEVRAKKLAEQFSRHNEDKRHFIEDVTQHLFKRTLSPKYLKPLSEQDLKTQESKIGAGIFGQDENKFLFWNEDRYNWYFHRITDSPKGKPEDVTIHYEVGVAGILKLCSKDDTPNQFVYGKELENLDLATEMYLDRVIGQIYMDVNITNKDNHDRSKLAA
jgi:hypothetical protein